MRRLSLRLVWASRSTQPSAQARQAHRSDCPTARLQQDLPIFRPGSTRSNSLRDAVPPVAGRSSRARGSAGRPQAPSATPMFSRLSHSLRRHRCGNSALLFSRDFVPTARVSQQQLSKNATFSRAEGGAPPGNQTALLSLSSVVPHNEENDDEIGSSGYTARQSRAPGNAKVRSEPPIRRDIIDYDRLARQQRTPARSCRACFARCAQQEHLGSCEHLALFVLGAVTQRRLAPRMRC